ncbi:flagellar hook-associated protein FlgK [Sphingomonas japonica]|uniref:Flagellar hook-associated protein 1 n=1 Tax=Sphingomonas japonica TaxID=511662 RepID=A0ABX0U0A4_9SPHN|nr:flagellar hook-associated protein FlgK [Sphingomonas japonica]NIJ24001.1 flagellar hook-associated protein 1 FlgK [Sphingomonas japonica]
MSDMLAIGASGVRAYQSALTSTSENIANAGVDGYSRRTTTLRDISPSGSSLTGGSVRNGSGVAIIDIERAGDQFRSAEVRSTSSELGKSEAGIVWLETIERALSGSRLTDGLAAFFNAAQNVAADPSSLASRAVMLDKASGLAGSFASTATTLATAAGDLDATANQAVRDLNVLSEALAKVNAGLGRASPGTSGQAGLLDQRDRLLDSMSALIDVDVQLDDFGRASVRAGGVAGPVLIAGEVAGYLSYARNDEGAVALTLSRNQQATLVTANSGAIAGIADGAQRIADARAMIEDLATEFVDGINALQAQGDDLTGTAGAAMFDMPAGASSMKLTLDDPRGIAAAARGGGTRDNANLAEFATFRDEGRFETRLTELNLINASALQGRKSVADAQSIMHDQAVAGRDALTGVNLDEEAVDLMRFQQAYQASSRVIQIARETLQSILDIR